MKAWVPPSASHTQDEMVHSCSLDFERWMREDQSSAFSCTVSSRLTQAPQGPEKLPKERIDLCGSVNSEAGGVQASSLAHAQRRGQKPVLLFTSQLCIPLVQCQIPLPQMPSVWFMRRPQSLDPAKTLFLSRWAQNIRGKKDLLRLLNVGSLFYLIFMLIVIFCKEIQLALMKFPLFYSYN